VQILRGVDVDRGTLARYFSDEIWSKTHQRAGPFVTTAGEEVPRLRAQPDRVTATPPVGGDGDRGVDRGDGAPRLGGDERLVAEADDDGRGTHVARRVDPSLE
jgi:hypothetical protein